MLGPLAVVSIVVAVVVVLATRGTSSAGVDNGGPGSRCEPRAQRLSRPAEPGTRAGTFAGDYYELGDPTPPQPAAPLMLVIHGGGWTDDGPGQVQSVRDQADMWRALGWRTLNLDYHACARSLTDVLAFYDHFHGLARGGAICADGLSAGGQLALMLAAYRPVRCVIALAPETDLPALAKQRTSKSSTLQTGQPTSAGPVYAYNLAVAAFGASRLAAMSPALQAKHIRARVLLAVGTNDIFVPEAQLLEFANRHPGYTRLLMLPVGGIVWLHGKTTARGIQEATRAERELADAARRNTCRCR
jgi:acetyl esterase/lipase